MSWTPWQSMQVGTSGLPSTRAWPWTLSRYFFWISAWQRAHVCGMPTRPSGSSFPSSPVIFFWVCGLWQSEQTAAFLLPPAIALRWTPSSCFLNCSSWHCSHEV